MSDRPLEAAGIHCPFCGRVEQHLIQTPHLVQRRRGSWRAHEPARTYHITVARLRCPWTTQTMYQLAAPEDWGIA